ncbi:MAG: molybdopterin-binding protein [Desulfatiglans sp.]|jgi:molybdenum cofactor synthesis domain-containing protein|nr:molybdopterin-binding protein [Desulfatiglans sp.]
MNDLRKKSTFDVDYLQEDDTSAIIAKAASGNGIRLTGMPDGGTGFFSSGAGVLKVNKEALLKINSIVGIFFSTIHGNHAVTDETPVGEIRTISFETHEKNIREAEKICKESSPVIEIKPLRSLKVGIITTGTEIYSGRIKDKFGLILKEKFARLNCEVIKQVFVPDDVEKTVASIHELVSEGADLVALTGGMSVDPDDLTPLSIRKTGAKIVTYGVPIYPGGMFLLAYLGDVPVLGLPGCVMYHRASIFDLVLPLIIAGETVTREYVLSLGHGGLCARCEECRYPVCGFGKQ